MNSTLLNSYSGIKTHQFGLDSISNNIANVNTTGYRESRPEFETLFAPKTSANGPTSNEVNLGVTASSNAISTKSGSYRVSDGEFDLAYQGKGWFVVGENKSGEMEIKKDNFTQKQENYFTRDGNFGKDAQGYLVNPRGYYLYGVNLGKIQNGFFVSNPQDDDKNLSSGKLSPLQIPQDLRFKPLESTKVDLAINLNKNDNPSNAYQAFLKNGKVDVDQVLQSDANIFFANQKALDLQANKEAKITLTNQDGEEKTFSFNYGQGENAFKSLKELQTLIKDQTGLDLKVITQDENSTNPSLRLELTSPSILSTSSMKISGGIFDALQMSTFKEKKLNLSSPYNPNQSYSPNELVSYLGITFRRIGNEGSSNPIEDRTNWEVVDTQKVKNFQEGKTYQAGEVVRQGGGIYLMDKQNQFLKISEDKQFEFPKYNPQEQYAQDSFVEAEGKIYKRIAPLGNSNPKDDPKSWEEISLGEITSLALEVPRYKSSVEIYDNEGKKYFLVSEYKLIEGENPQTKSAQKWEVLSYIQDIENGNKIGGETLHNIAFDENQQAIAKEVEIDFKGKKISYNIAGTQERKSSDGIHSPSEVMAYFQDGSTEGILEHTNINENGVITLKFSNGKQEVMGRVGIVAFNNDQGLSKAGGNLFGLERVLVGEEKQLKSGNPILGWNEEGKLTMGNVKQGYLETSNVDVGNALTELILMQRGYSMNAKSFTTGDEMIKEAINLKK